MSFESNSPNMNLPVPGVGLTEGPQWADDVNSCMAIIDQHNHSPGNGVQITPAGLNMNADLSFLSLSNITNLRSTRYAVQASPLSLPSDLGCTYVSGVDLFYNDENGNQIQITANGGVNGSPGSISNLASPASASYVSGSQTFVWQSAANTPANMDAGSYIFRNITSNSKGLTLSPPNAMGADYALTLPALPAGTSFMTLASTGSMAAPVAYPLPTVGLADQAVSQAKLAPRATGSTVGAGGFASSGGVNFSSNFPQVVPFLTVTITTTGRPVFVGLQGDIGGTSDAYVGSSLTTGTSTRGAISFFRNPMSPLQTYDLSYKGTTSGVSYVRHPASAFWCIDTVVAGTYTYIVNIFPVFPTSVDINECTLIAYEI